MPASQSQRRAVVTGIGLISPLGITNAAYWQGISQRRSGVRLLTGDLGGGVIDFGGAAHEFSGAIDDFGPLEGDAKKSLRKATKIMCRECQMGVAAAQRAIADSGLGPGRSDPDRSGVIFGCDYLLSPPEDLCEGFRKCIELGQGKFHFSDWGPHGIPQLTPLWLLKYLPNMPASHIAILNDFRGPNNSLTLREASSLTALIEALRYIQRGWADVMVIGATGSRLQPIKAMHARLTEQVSERGDRPPETVARPFDLHRTGSVLGDGAGAIVIETLEHAQARGAQWYGEIRGGASAVSVSRQGVAQRRRALAHAAQRALRDAQTSPESLGHVLAHGLGTYSSDYEEAGALCEALGSARERVPVTAAKSYLGNLGAGSALVEMAASLFALRSGKLFPVLNYTTPDPECPISVCNNADTPAGDSFLQLSTTPQGQAVAVVASRSENPRPLPE